MLDSEMGVLGSCLLESDAIDIALEELTADDFSTDRHRELFKTIVDLVEEKVPVDMVTVAAALDRRKTLGMVGGSAYLAELVNFVPAVVPPIVKHYTGEIKDRAVVRRIMAAVKAVEAGAREGMKAGALVELAEEQFFSLKPEAKSGPRHIKESMKVVFKNLANASRNKGDVSGLRTGLARLDWMLGGLRPGKLYIIAARPAIGKTALAMNMMEAAAVDQGIPTLGFSLEMPDEELAERAICSLARVDGSKARLGILQDQDFSKITGIANDLSAAPLWIDETPALSITEIRSRSRRMKRRHNIGLVVVDYIQLARGTNNSKSREQEISEISRGLKTLAKELQVPVVALSQLNRDLEKRADKRPMLSDLRESGAIEQDADVVMGLYREAVYCEACRIKKCQEPKHVGTGEIILLKQRSGPTGTIDVVWLDKWTRFATKEKDREERYG